MNEEYNIIRYHLCSLSFDSKKKNEGLKMENTTVVLNSI